MLKFLRKLIAIIVKLFIGIAALITVAMAIGLYSNHRALKAAEHFCGQIALGSNLSKSVELAKSEGIRYIESLHQFYFQGWVFNAALCIVTVEEDKIISKQVEMRSD